MPRLSTIASLFAFAGASVTCGKDSLESDGNSLIQATKANTAQMTHDGEVEVGPLDIDAGDEEEKDVGEQKPVEVAMSVIGETVRVRTARDEKAKGWTFGNACDGLQDQDCALVPGCTSCKFSWPKGDTSDEPWSGPDAKCRCDCTDVTVNMHTANWGSEISWDLGGCQSDTQYGNAQVYHQTCCLSSGANTLKCEDSYGDGWHGGYITVTWSDGTQRTYCNSFSSGHLMEVVAQAAVQ